MVWKLWDHETTKKTAKTRQRAPKGTTIVPRTRANRLVPDDSCCSFVTNLLFQCSARLHLFGALLGGHFSQRKARSLDVLPV